MIKRAFLVIFSLLTVNRREKYRQIFSPPIIGGQLEPLLPTNSSSCTSFKCKRLRSRPRAITMAFAAPASLPCRRAATSRAGRVACPRMGPWRAGEKDAAFELQQQILARRRDKQRNKEYFDSVRERRDDQEAKLAEKRLVVRDGEDPLVPWQRLKDKGFIDEAGYAEEDEGGIPVPMASFGIRAFMRRFLVRRATLCADVFL